MVKIELLEKEDLRKILKWNENKSADYLLQWAGPLYGHPLTLDQLEDYFFKEVKKFYRDTFIYKILLIDTGEVIGTVELREVDKENKIGRVCRFLIGEESNRGKGIGRTVLKKLLKIAFEELKFEKITLGVFDFNENAIRCYEGAGFIKEKLIENARKSSWSYWNLYDMEISKENWLSL